MPGGEGHGCSVAAAWQRLAGQRRQEMGLALGPGAFLCGRVDIK